MGIIMPCDPVSDIKVVQAAAILLSGVVLDRESLRLPDGKLGLVNIMLGRQGFVSPREDIPSVADILILIQRHPDTTVLNKLLFHGLSPVSNWRAAKPHARGKCLEQHWFGDVFTHMREIDQLRGEFYLETPCHEHEDAPGWWCWRSHEWLCGQCAPYELSAQKLCEERAFNPYRESMLYYLPE